MRAAAQSPSSARLVGIPVGRMLMLGWGLASLLGALAGVLVAHRLFLDTNLMAGVLVYSFAGAALGGFDSPIGAVVGSWIIGVTEALAGTYIDVIGSDLKVLVPLGIIFVVLLVRPSGLFGSPEVTQSMSLVRVTAGSRAHSRCGPAPRCSSRSSSSRIPFNSNPSVNGNLTLVMSYAVAAMGLGLLVGYAGQISLGQGAFFAIGAYAAGVHAGQDRPAVPAGRAGSPAAVTFLIGLAFGIPAVRLRGLYLALVTLALAVAVGPVIKRAEPITGGVSGLSVPQPPVPRLARGRPRTSGSTCSAWW